MRNYLNRRLKPVFAAVLALLLTALPACAEWTDAVSDDAGTTDWTTQGANADEGVYSGETLNKDADLMVAYVGTGSETINPLLCDNRDLYGFEGLAFESLVELDDNGQPAPLLAENWTHDGKKWVFTLRTGIHFHDGTELSAYDVLSSYQRILMAGSMSPWYSRVNNAIKGMETTGDYELTVTMNYTGYAALYGMTFPVVSSTTVNATIARGTGPFWITQYVPGSGVRLERNPLWWKYDPKIESITLIQYSTSTQAIQALHSGDVNVLCSRSAAASYSRKLSKFTGLDYLTNTFEVLVPNLGADSVMSDLRMRKAVMYAIDSAVIAANAYGGMGIQCEVPVNPGTWLYETQSAIYYYSPERALQYVLDCGWRDLTGDGKMNMVDGIRLVDLTVRIITYNDNMNNMRENAANMIATYLETVGFNVEVEALASYEKVQTRIKYGNYDLALVGMNLSDVPSLSALLVRRGALNLNGYNNDEIADMISQTSTVQTDTELKSLYSKIQLKLVETLPVMGLVFRTGTVLATRSLGGLSGIRAGDMLNGIEFMTK